MKTKIIFLLIIISAGVNFKAISQAPDRFSYQAVIRDSDNELLANTEIGIKISILQGAENGNSVFEESHQIATNEAGVVSTQIGGGVNISGDLTSVNWQDGPYFISTEIDPEGGTNYSITSSSQLLSVPYALSTLNVSIHPNVLIGTGAGENTPETKHILAIGDSSLFNNSMGSSSQYDGSFNIAIGSKALYSNTIGRNNTAIGIQSLWKNTTGRQNVALGMANLYENTAGEGNTALGDNSMYGNTTGSNNTSVGIGALLNNTTGNSNVAIGAYSLFRGASLNNIVAIGDSALYNNGYDATGNNQGAFNTAVGSKSLFSNTLGEGNTSVGFQSLMQNLTGQNNTAIGSEALHFNTTGYQNTSNGFRAMYQNTTGYSNTAVGYFSLYSNTAANFNVAVGNQSLFSNTLGERNTAIGNSALYSNTSGNYNTAIGGQSMFSNSTGVYNTSVGCFSLQDNAIGFRNTAMGYRALESNTASQNSAFGSTALPNNTTGVSNTAVGNSALTLNTTGSINTAVGSSALSGNTTGAYNTALGGNTLTSNTIGDYNTAIGFSAGPIVANLVNTTTIGYFAQTAVSNSVRIGNNNVISIGGSVAWSNLSDGRFKTNVDEDVPGLPFIMKLRPVTYTWDVDKLDRYTDISDSVYQQHPKLLDARNRKETKIYTGFIAQEVEKAARECHYDFSGVIVPENENDLYNLSYAEFVVPLVKAIQELKAENEELKTSLKLKDEILEKEINELKQRLSEINSAANKELFVQMETK
jgi:hypothetical protein